jgi:hypothetical protein
VSGQRAHVVIAGFVAKPLDGVILRSSSPFLRNTKTTGLWFISQIDLKGVCYFVAFSSSSRLILSPGYMPHWLSYYITDGMEDTMLRICSQSEQIGSKDSAAAVLQHRFARKLESSESSSTLGQSSG